MYPILRQYKWVTRLAVSLFIFFTAIGRADSQGLSPVEGAKKEGKVVWYGSMQLEQALPLVRKFEQKYSFLKVEYLRDKGEGSANRIMTEARARTHRADVILAKLRAIVLLKKREMLAPYKSAEHKFIPERFRDPDGYWTTFYTSVLVVGYNSKLVNDHEVPKNYQALLSSRWRREIGIDSYDYDWFTGLLEVMGKENGTAYMKKLAALEPIMRAGHTLLAQLLIGGEFPLAIQYPNEVEWMKRKGAPVNWAKMDFPAPTSLTSIGMLAKAPNPNAGKLLYDFLLSEEAAKYLVSVERLPARAGIKPDWLPKDFQFFPLGESLISDVMDRNTKEFDNIFKKGHS